MYSCNEIPTPLPPKGLKHPYYMYTIMRTQKLWSKWFLSWLGVCRWCWYWRHQPSISSSMYGRYRPRSSPLWRHPEKKHWPILKVHGHRALDRPRRSPAKIDGRGTSWAAELPVKRIRIELQCWGEAVGVSCSCIGAKKQDHYHGWSHS